MSVLIKNITPRNILSFGPNTPPVELGSLNVLIGSNGSGKSNFIEILSMMRFLAKNDKQQIPQFAQDIKYKNSTDNTAEISLCLNVKDKISSHICHLVGFECTDIDYRILREVINNPYSLGYTYNSDRGNIQNIRYSILSQLNNKYFNNGVLELRELYDAIAIYRNWSFGSSPVLKSAQKSDLGNELLEADLSNFYIYLARLRSIPVVRRRIIDLLKKFYEPATDFNITPFGGLLLLDIEEGDVKIPANRMSDGTLRFLVLIALLCDPKPPPVICIEEPELGMHPDMMHVIADLLVEAAERTQIIVTTHSPQLIDSFTDTPDVVIVCEKRNEQTEMKRLDPDLLKPWLEKYSLGEFWRQGSIGGNRW